MEPDELKPLKRIAKLWELAECGEAMRMNQKAFFKFKSRSALINSKKYEARFDELLEEVFKLKAQQQHEEQTKLF